MTKEDIATIVGYVKYKDWGFHLSYEPLYLQVMFVDGEETWFGRKWLLSVHMTESEVVQTCLKAVLTAEEHEAREKFKYHDRAIFGPHINVNDLWDMCYRLDARTSFKASDSTMLPQAFNPDYTPGEALDGAGE